jgi:coenzyme F420-0:L-glutamate ligase/coenzyme F420-1:gamma-L-glutamate ligase
VTGPAVDALVVLPVDGLPEVTPGADLAGMLATVAALADGDVLVVTSKVVSKAEGRVLRGDRAGAVDAETVRVVARRGETRIVENRQGLVMAAAGVDASNVEPGTVVVLPEDPDRSARRLREEVRRRTGRNVAVVVSDTAGRAWRLGQTDIAIGVAGLVPLADCAGKVDAHGN